MTLWDCAVLAFGVISAGLILALHHVMERRRW